METTYRTFLDRRGRIRKNPPLFRSHCHRDVRYARIEAPMGNMGGIAKLRAVFLHGAAMGGGGRLFPLRSARFRLGVRSRSATGDGGPSQTIVWRGPSPKVTREGRERKCRRYASARCFGGGGFFCDARGSMGGLFGRMCNVGDRVSQGDSIRGDPWISGAHRGGQMVRRDASDSWGRMDEPGAVEIGGQRNGVAVDGVVGETLLSEAERTQIRVAGRLPKRWIWGDVGGTDWCAFRVLGRAGAAINGIPRGVRGSNLASSESGIQSASHAAHDGWRAAAARPWGIYK